MRAQRLGTASVSRSRLNSEFEVTPVRIVVAMFLCSPLHFHLFLCAYVCVSMCVQVHVCVSGGGTIKCRSAETILLLSDGPLSGTWSTLLIRLGSLTRAPSLPLQDSKQQLSRGACRCWGPNSHPSTVIVNTVAAESFAQHLKSQFLNPIFLWERFFSETGRVEGPFKSVDSSQTTQYSGRSWQHLAAPASAFQDRQVITDKRESKLGLEQN